MKQLQKFGLVMNANFESIASMAVAFYAARWLNENHPKAFDWAAVTYVLGLLLIVRSWYVVLRVLIRDQKAPEIATAKSESKDDSSIK